MNFLEIVNADISCIYIRTTNFSNIKFEHCLNMSVLCSYQEHSQKNLEVHMTALLEVTALLEYLDLLQCFY